MSVETNAVDPNRLRGAQARTFNHYVLHTSRQLSRLSDVGTLELDVQRGTRPATGNGLRETLLMRP